MGCGVQPGEGLKHWGKLIAADICCWVGCKRGLGALWSWRCAGLQLLAGAGRWCRVLSPGRRAPRSDLCGWQGNPMGAGKAPHGPHLGPAAHPTAPLGAGWCQHRAPGLVLLLPSTGKTSAPSPCAAPHWGLWLPTAARYGTICQRGGGRALMPISISPHIAAWGQIPPRDPQVPCPRASSIHGCRDSGP